MTYITEMALAVLALSFHNSPTGHLDRADNRPLETANSPHLMRLKKTT